MRELPRIWEPQMRRILLDPYCLSLLFAGLAQFTLFLRWLFRRMRDDELHRAFLHDMATNHLPHIYGLLVKLCEKQGIAIEPTPAIHWIDLDRSRKS